ncbi:MAG: hypothetical protein R2758_10885 [Bacteroidales bacterium]
MISSNPGASNRVRGNSRKASIPGEPAGPGSATAAERTGTAATEPEAGSAATEPAGTTLGSAAGPGQQQQGRGSSNRDRDRGSSNRVRGSSVSGSGSRTVTRDPAHSRDEKQGQYRPDGDRTRNQQQQRSQDYPDAQAAQHRKNLFAQETVSDSEQDLLRITDAEGETSN